MNGPREDKAWADHYTPAVCAIVGPRLLVPAPIEKDMKEGVDLVVLRARDMTIAMRMRRPGFANRYPGEFTLRRSRPNGFKTELSKVVDGWGDWLFYGHAEGETEISEWVLIDLHALRAAWSRHPKILHGPYGQVSGVKPNGDGTDFMWFRAAKLPPDVTIDSSRHWRPLFPPHTRQHPLPLRPV